MKAFIGRRMRPSSARCRVLLGGVVVVDAAELHETIGRSVVVAPSAWRGMASSEGGGDDHRLDISPVVSEAPASALLPSFAQLCLGSDAAAAAAAVDVSDLMWNCRVAAASSTGQYVICCGSWLAIDLAALKMKDSATGVLDF